MHIIIIFSVVIFILLNENDFNNLSLNMLFRMIVLTFLSANSKIYQCFLFQVDDWNKLPKIFDLDVVIIGKRITKTKRSLRLGLYIQRHNDPHIQ